MNNEDIFSKIDELTERISKLEKMCDSSTSSKTMCNMSTPPNKRWRGEKGDDYYFINAIGIVRQNKEDTSEVDDLRYGIGNYFKTKEEAEFESERLKVIADLKDWATPGNDVKYIIDIRNTEEGVIHLEVEANCCYSYQASELCFESKEIAKDAIRAVGEDRIIKYYFRRGVDEK